MLLLFEVQHLRLMNAHKREEEGKYLKERALAMLLLLGVLDIGHEYCAHSLLEGGLDAFKGTSRAENVFVCADLLSKSVALSASDGVLIALSEAVHDVGVVGEIDLGADQNDGSVRAKVANLRIPLCAHILEGRGRDGAVDEEENIGLRVRERTEAIVVVLTSGIPETKINYLTIIDLEESRVVVKDGWAVVIDKGVCSERDQEGGLANSAIANDDALDVTNMSSRHFVCCLLLMKVVCGCGLLFS